MNPVPLAPPFFIQPQKAKDSSNVALSSKCYAYATLNALSRQHVSMEYNSAPVGTQAQADAFVTSLDMAMGGGPARVLQKLTLQTKEYACQFEAKILKRAAFANANNLPVVVATTVTPPGSAHWVSFTGVSADGKTLLAIDQQNPGRGTLSFVPVEKTVEAKKITVLAATVAGGATYEINNINILVTTTPQKDALNNL